MKVWKAAVGMAIAAGALLALFFGVKAQFPRRYAEVVRSIGPDEALVYAVMKAESGFREDAVSRAGAVGLMQLRPKTARFICERENLPFEEERLKEGEYNTRIGCLYLRYLLQRFPVPETALAAYNAGEGTVAEWLKDSSCSADGRVLTRIPYPETRGYIKKVGKFRKIYEFFY